MFYYRVLIILKIKELEMIKVSKKDNNTFLVEVKVNGYKTTHNVYLDDDYYKRLTGERVGKEDLIKKSFEFLLERESNRTILSEFDLKVIKRYFPEYENVIKGKI